jgi:serine/threonine protein kinase/hemoglobin-like flavoprotein/class 3 adenylate cyclase
MSRPLQIGKYRLLDRIGEGAMGEVFRAHDPVLDRQIALKVISAGDEDRRQRFRREAQSAARLTHPNIVVVHDFGEDSGRFFMAMELLPGSDLKRAIAASAFPDAAAKLQVMEQVCDAVAYAHSMSIVHRDLKPANIFLLPNGQVKILDFGLARVGQSDMTGTGTILGTPNYMAPEQIRGARIDSRADIFSLGAVFYELFSGRKAFQGESLHTVLYKVLQEDPEPLAAISPAIPVAVSDMVKKALAKDPAVRFQSLAEMRDSVRALRDRGPAGAALSLAELMREHRSDTVIVDRKTADAVRNMVWPDDRSMRSTSTPTPSGPSMSVDAPPARVTFAGESGGDLIVEVPRGQTLLTASLAAGIPHMHECGGNARCSTCRVLVLANPENLPARDSAELKLSKRLGFGEDIRLACQTRPRGPVRVRRLILDQDDVQLTRADRTPQAGNETPLAVLYAGIREFPQFVRRALPYDAVHVLNRYYLQIGEAVLANGGHIDKYLTGGVLALFGIHGEEAKVKCTNALRAALRMQRRMEPLNAYLGQHFGVTFTLEAGLHYGRMIVGHMGHPDHQRLTAIGEPAALATAAAAANQHHGSTILATEEMVNIVESDIATGSAVHEHLGGDRERVLYEILDFAKPDTHYIVQSSFERVAQRRDEAASIFYSHLFQIAPHTRPMFDGVDMATQGAMLMNMLAAAVRGLDRLEELKPVLEDLGRRHARYGVRIEHYSPVEECLLHTVKTMLGDEFNLDVQLAWTQIYNFVAQTMIEAAATA